MSLDLRTLRPVDPETVLAQADTIAWRAVVKLHPDRALPDYVVLRSRISARICTVDVPVGTWHRLNQDPAVDSVTASRALPVV